MTFTATQIKKKFKELDRTEEEFPLGSVTMDSIEEMRKFASEHGDNEVLIQFSGEPERGEAKCQDTM